jgi:hypothetical protein
MNASQITSIVVKLVTFGLAFLAGKGYITAEQVDAGGQAVNQLLEGGTILSSAIMVIYGIYRSVKTHKDA